MDKRAQVAEKKRAAQAKEAAQVAKEEKKKKEDVGGTTPKAGKRPIGGARTASSLLDLDANPSKGKYHILIPPNPNLGIRMLFALEAFDPSR